MLFPALSGSPRLEDAGDGPKHSVHRMVHQAQAPRAPKRRACVFSTGRAATDPRRRRARRPRRPEPTTSRSPGRAAPSTSTAPAKPRTMTDLIGTSARPTRRPSFWLRVKEHMRHLPPPVCLAGGGRTRRALLGGGSVGASERPGSVIRCWSCLLRSWSEQCSQVRRVPRCAWRALRPPWAPGSAARRRGTRLQSRQPSHGWAG